MNVVVCKLTGNLLYFQNECAVCQSRTLLIYYSMRFLVAFFLISLNFSYSNAQEKSKLDLFKPFTLLIIKPEKASIADSLVAYAYSIEKSHKDKYFAAIRIIEELKEHSTQDAKEETELKIQEMKSKAEEYEKFKYYHTIADQTLFELRILFNKDFLESKNAPEVAILEGDIIDPVNLVTRDLEVLRKHYKEDYTVTFEDVHTDKRNGVLILKYILTLFSRKEGKVILRQEIEGNAPVDNFKPLSEIFPPGNSHEFGIHCDNYLECVIESAVRFSTEELFKAIGSRQKK